MKKLVGVVLLALSSVACADDKTGETWVTLGGISKHINPNTTYNESNWGLGLEYKLDRERAIVGGFYDNSIFRQTRYVGMAYTPWKVGDFRLGVIGGVADGYTAVNRGHVFPMVAPVAVYEQGRIGVNVLLIPCVSGSPAVGVQFKFRM